MDKYIWVDAALAAELAEKQDATTELLRKGHGFLELQQFVSFLRSKELRIIVFPNKTAALVTCGPSAEGVVLNILTVQGSIKACEESIPVLEEAAKEAGCALVISVGYAGWARVMKRQGYEIQPRLLMRKRL